MPQATYPNMSQGDLYRWSFHWKCLKLCVTLNLFSTTWALVPPIVRGTWQIQHCNGYHIIAHTVYPTSLWGSALISPSLPLLLLPPSWHHCYSLAYRNTKYQRWSELIQIPPLVSRGGRIHNQAFWLWIRHSVEKNICICFNILWRQMKYHMF